MYHVFYQISPPLLTFNLTDPLIGLLNEVQMIQDQTPSPLTVCFGMWPVGEAVVHPIRLHRAQKQLMLLVRGQQTASEKHQAFQLS